MSGLLHRPSSKTGKLDKIITKNFYSLDKVADLGSGSGVNSGSYYNAVAIGDLEQYQLYLFDAYHGYGSWLYWGLFWVIKTASNAGYVDKIFPTNNETSAYQGTMTSTHVQFKEVNAGWNGPTHYGKYFRVLKLHNR